MILGLDLGTTSLKAAAFDDRGRRLAHAARPLPTRRAPGGVAEQDPRDWLDALWSALAEMPPGARAIGVTAQANTHVLADAQGLPLGPAILWSDTRAAGEAALLDARVAPEDRAAWWGGGRVDASHALARLAWWRAHAPEAYANARALLLPKDLLLHALTGEATADPLSHVGLVGPDLLIPEGALALVPGAAALLPPLRDPLALAGRHRGVPVAVGTMDALAGVLGLGLRAAGDLAWLSGTSEVLAAAGGEPRGEPGILVFPPALGLRLHAGPTQSGGASLDWLAGATGAAPAQLAEEAAQAPRAPLFLPHLAGERAPLWEPDLRGAFLGLEAGMGRAALARGVVEGVAYSARLVLDSLGRSTGLPGGTLLAGGGGFASDAAAQLRADALGRPLKRLATPDAGVLGAAALAAVAAGLAPSLPEALARLARHDRSFEPRDADRHAQGFALWRDAIATLRPLSRALARR